MEKTLHTEKETWSTPKLEELTELETRNDIGAGMDGGTTPGISES